MDDRILDGDRMLRLVDSSSEHAQETPATGRTWAPEQRMRLEQTAASIGYSPQQPVEYLPAQQQMSAQEPAPVCRAPVQPAAFDDAFGGDDVCGNTVNYGVAQPTQPTQRSAVAAPLQLQMATPTQPQPQGYRLQPLPTATEMEAPQSDVSQYSSSALHRGRVLLVVAVSVFALGLVGGVLGGYWLWPGKGAAASSSSAAAASAANKLTTLRVGSGPFICSSSEAGVSCWGVDAQTSTQGARVSSTVMPSLEKAKASVLSMGKGSVMVVDDSGKVYTWGADEIGQPGKKTDEALVNRVVEVDKLSAAPIASVSGYEHTCTFTKGTVWCFDSDRYGQVNGTASDIPLGLTRVDKIDRAAQIGTPGYDMWATVDKGTWIWGNNSWEQADPSQSVINMASTLIPANS